VGEITSENYAGRHNNFHLKLCTEAQDFLDKEYISPAIQFVFFFSKSAQVKTKYTR